MLLHSSNQLSSVQSTVPSVGCYIIALNAAKLAWCPAVQYSLYANIDESNFFYVYVYLTCNDMPSTYRGS